MMEVNQRTTDLATKKKRKENSRHDRDLMELMMLTELIKAWQRFDGIDDVDRVNQGMTDSDGIEDADGGIWNNMMGR